MAEYKDKKPAKKKDNKKAKAPKEEKKDYKPLPRDEKFVEEQAKKLEEKEDVKKEEKKPDKKDKVEKPVLEREYIIPLRRKVNKAVRYKRAKKAIRVIREFLAKHMKVEYRDLKMVKVDRWLNEEIWFRGIKKPPAKIKVIAKKFADGMVWVELAEIPDIVKWKIAKEKKKEEGVKTVKKVEKPKEKEDTEEKKKDEEEKEKSSVEAGLKRQKQAAKQMEHTSKGAHAKITTPRRKSLKK